MKFDANSKLAICIVVQKKENDSVSALYICHHSVAL